jgi:hypothetical protein
MLQEGPQVPHLKLYAIKKISSEGEGKGEGGLMTWKKYKEVEISKKEHNMQMIESIGEKSKGISGNNI